MIVIVILNKSETIFRLKYFHSKKYLSQFYCETTIYKQDLRKFTLKTLYVGANDIGPHSM
jgi:hypothetical protein